jgi:hypothetical protein
MNEGQTLTFTGMRSSTRCVPHTCVEMRSRETLRLINRSSAAIGAQIDHRWCRAICKSRMFDPDICSMRRESGGAVGFHGCSVYALPVTYGTDHGRLRYVVQGSQST